MKKSFIMVTIAVILVVLIVLTFFLIPKSDKQQNQQSLQTDQHSQDNQQVQADQNPTEQTQEVRWQNTNGDWVPSETPPKCPNQIIAQVPVDMNLVVGAIWPGQYRGEDYKAHGGFRFEDSNNEIEVRAPMDSYLNRGSRYLQNGEVQYLLEFINPCGIMYRLDHLAVLSPELQKIVETFPEPKEGQSSTVNVNDFNVKAGDLIATKIGMTGSAFMDFGVYDLRQKNAASQDTQWLAEHEGDQAPYGVCWFDWLPNGYGEKMRELPTGVEGKISDYC